MRKRTILVVVIAVLSSICVLCYMFDTRQVSISDSIVIVDADIVLRAQGTGEIVGYLKKGVAFYSPSLQDLSVSDPGDAELHKAYIRIPLNVCTSYELTEKGISHSVKCVRVIEGAHANEKEAKIIEQMDALDGYSAAAP
ncbi:MAG: hypothetical protein PHF14_08955 [Verrucomicrobiota bacterium]|nr:hypothetical protein [Verrucomicrobiota bacterium]